MAKIKRNKIENDTELNLEDRQDYEVPKGSRELSPEVQARLDRIMQEPLIVAIMVAKPDTLQIGEKNRDILVTGLLMGSQGFYGIESGFPNKYQVAIDESIVIKNVQYIDPITVKLSISTVNAKPGTYDISFANSIGETLTGLGVLKIVDSKKNN